RAGIARISLDDSRRHLVSHRALGQRIGSADGVQADSYAQRFAADLHCRFRAFLRAQFILLHLSIELDSHWCRSRGPVESLHDYFPAQRVFGLPLYAPRREARTVSYADFGWLVDCHRRLCGLSVWRPLRSLPLRQRRRILLRLQLVPTDTPRLFEPENTH